MFHFCSINYHSMCYIRKKQNWKEKGKLLLLGKYFFYPRLENHLDIQVYPL